MDIDMSDAMAELESTPESSPDNKVITSLSVTSELTSNELTSYKIGPVHKTHKTESLTIEQEKALFEQALKTDHQVGIR